MSIDLSGVNTLNLSRKNLTDHDIHMFAFNSMTGNIINIYLSENSYLGSIRNSLLISDSCGLQVTTLYVTAKSTNISAEELRKYNRIATKTVFL